MASKTDQAENAAAANAPSNSKKEPKPTDLVTVRLSPKHPTQTVPYQRLKLMGPGWQIVDE